MVREFQFQEEWIQKTYQDFHQMDLKNRYGRYTESVVEFIFCLSCALWLRTARVLLWNICLFFLVHFAIHFVRSMRKFYVLPHIFQINLEYSFRGSKTVVKFVGG